MLHQKGKLKIFEKMLIWTAEKKNHGNKRSLHKGGFMDSHFCNIQIRKKLDREANSVKGGGTDMVSLKEAENIVKEARGVIYDSYEEFVDLYLFYDNEELGSFGGYNA